MKRPWLLLIVLSSAWMPARAANYERHFESDGHLVTCISESTAARITVVDNRSGRTVYSTVIDDVYSGHAHPVEFHNGHLYVIHRTGGTEGYRTFPETWTDQLCRHDRDGSKITLFTCRGLDFRVPPAEGYIAVTDGSSQNPGGGHLALLTPSGQSIKRVHVSDLHLEDIGDVWATDSCVFVGPGQPEAVLDRIVRVGVYDSLKRAYEFASCGFDLEYDFNPRTMLIIGSDMPFLVDTESGEEWERQHPRVHLYLYEVLSRNRRTVATSIAKRFSPRWLSDTTFVFTDPRSGKPVTRSIRSLRIPAR